MNYKYPKVNLDVIIIRNNKILIGLLTNKWSIGGNQVYGIPGRDIYFGEKIADALERIIKEEIGCKVIENKFITLTENFEFGNHYIGIGYQVKIDSNPKLLKPDDWEKWKWIEKDKLPKNMFSSAKSLIDCYLTKEKTP